MGTDASMLIGDLVIGFAIAFATAWVMIKAIEILYDLWKWGQITEDRIIRRLAEKRIAQMYPAKDKPTESQEIRKLLRTLIDHSSNGIIRLRWIPNNENGRKELRCIFANLTAGRFLGRTPDDLMDCDSEGIINLVTSGMDKTDSGRVLGEFHNAVHESKKIDVEVQNAPGKWLRMIGEPFAEDFGVIFVNISDRKPKQE